MSDGTQTDKLEFTVTTRDSRRCSELILAYLVYTCTQDEIALFIPLQGKDGTFVLAECAGQVPCKDRRTKKGSKSLKDEPSMHEPASRWQCCSRKLLKPCGMLKRATTAQTWFSMSE